MDQKPIDEFDNTDPEEKALKWVIGRVLAMKLAAAESETKE